MINKKVNFKALDCSGEMKHCYYIEVKCNKIGEDFRYSVEACAYQTSVPIILRSLFLTPEKAFEYVERVVAAYPRYDDERDSDINLAPLFQDPEIIEKKDGENNGQA